MVLFVPYRRTNILAKGATNMAAAKFRPPIKVNAKSDVPAKVLWEM
jgi:hypothetical protein